MRFARRSGIKLVAFFTVLASAMAVTLLPAATGDTIADHVLGQGDFLHGSANTVDGASLNTPNFVAVDRAGGHLYLSDTANNRVIGWSSVTGFVSGEPADFVLRQPDLYGSLKNGNGGPNTNPLNYFGPEGVAVDSQGNLYVADTGNDRGVGIQRADGHMRDISLHRTAANTVFGQLGDFYAGGCRLRFVHRQAQAPTVVFGLGASTVIAHDNLYVATRQTTAYSNTTLAQGTSVIGSGDTPTIFLARARRAPTSPM